MNLDRNNGMAHKPAAWKYDIGNIHIQLNMNIQSRENNYRPMMDI
jgi:hypothetical protein